MSDFQLSQLLIGVAFCFDLASFQFRNKVHVLLCLGMASIFIALHFWLLGAQTAAVVTLIAAARFFTATRTRSPGLMYLFLAAIAASAVYTYVGLLTVLVTLSASLSTWSAFRASNRRFRQMMMLCASIMVVHNALAGTPAGVVLELFFLGSNVVAYYRYYWRRNSTN